MRLSRRPAFYQWSGGSNQRMQKHHSRLPIILILIIVLSAASGSAAGANTRLSAWLSGGSRSGIGATTFSGEPDTPGIGGGNDGGKATGGSSKRGIIGDARTYVTAAIWLRMFEVRLLGR